MLMEFGFVALLPFVVFALALFTDLEHWVRATCKRMSRGRA